MREKNQKYIVIKERKGQILNEICIFYEKKSIVINERSVLFLMRDKKEKLTRKGCGCQREKSLVLHEKNCLYEVKVVVINKRKVVINERKIVVIKKETFTTCTVYVMCHLNALFKNSNPTTLALLT